LSHPSAPTVPKVPVSFAAYETSNETCGMAPVDHGFHYHFDMPGSRRDRLGISDA